MSLGIFFVCFLLFLGIWTFSKEWLVALGVALVLWSVLFWFVRNQDEQVAERYERKFGNNGPAYEPSHTLFKQ